MPMRTTQTAAMLGHRDLEGSASDFGFPDEDDRDPDSPYDDADDGELDDSDFSGSGDGAEGSRPSAKVRQVCWWRPWLRPPLC